MVQLEFLRTPLSHFQQMAAINEFINAHSKLDEEGNNQSNIKHVQYDTQSYFGIRQANEKTFGEAFIPTYHLKRQKPLFL